MHLTHYTEQARAWPTEGRHVLARYDDETVVVYQAYRPEIGHFAAKNGYFGGAFSFTRMSWIKPGFLWMMYRSGWGTKEGQETTLAIHLRRSAFDTILAAAVPSSFDRETFADRAAWQAAVSGSDVRLQWDPDHDPTGVPVARRAIQLGLRGDTLARYAREWIVAIEDVSETVARLRIDAPRFHEGALLTPRERVYPIADDAVARRLGTS